MMKALCSLVLLLATGGLLACSGSPQTTAEGDLVPAQGGPAGEEAGAAEEPMAAPMTAAGGEYGRQNLLDPTNPLLNETAPDVYRARFETSKGDFVVEVQRDWAPLGADRFYNLVRNGFYDDVRFFRCISGFMVQFGISGDPKVTQALSGWNIKDDPVKVGNKRGQVTFAKTNMPHSRTTQVFINFVDNDSLDGMGFASFGKVVEGMEVVDSLYAGYGEGQPRGRGPAQQLIQSRGNEYLVQEYPELDYVKRATIEQG